MNITISDITTLSRVVRTAAAEELLPRFTTVARQTKADGSFVTEADHAMQNRLISELRRHWPEFGFLGEEMTPQEQSTLLEYPGAGLWIVDPLDGTSNYTAGIPHFSVSIALLQNNQISMALVHDPSRDECFTAIAGQGAQLNGMPLTRTPPPEHLRQCNASVDYKRLDIPLKRRLAEQQPFSSQRNFGSVALDWCWVAAGRFHTYLHGQQHIWDYAAGHRIFCESGGYSQTLDGEDVFRPVLTPRSAIAASDKGLFQAWSDWIAEKTST